jgi:hypothetical protein
MKYLFPFGTYFSLIPNPDKPEPNRINRVRESCSKRMEY